jgi:uncharacterized membrane protein
MPTHAATILAVLVAVVRPLAARADATFTTIDVPEARATRLWGTNSVGDTYVGHYQDFALVIHGFRLTSDGEILTIDVPFPDAINTVARGINKRGDIVGRYLRPDGTSRGWLRRDKDEGFTLIEVEGAPSTLAHGINNARDVVGAYGDVGEEHGFLWRDDGSGSFLTIDVPGSVFTILRAITDVGDLIGWFGTADGMSHGFVWTASGLRPIDFPGATETIAAAINATGDIVGRFVASGDTHGFLFRDDAFQQIDFPEAVSTEASGIADNGDVVGFYDLDESPPPRIHHGYLLRGLYKGRKTQ